MAKFSDLTSKQKGGLLLIAAAFVLVLILVYLMFGRKSPKEPDVPQQENVVVAVPAADDPKDNVSGNEQFRKGNDVTFGKKDSRVEDYWDNLNNGGAAVASDDRSGMQGQDGRSDARRGSQRFSEEDFIQKEPETAPQPAAPRSAPAPQPRKERSRKDMENDVIRMYQIQDSLARLSAEKSVTGGEAEAKEPEQKDEPLPTLASSEGASAKRSGVVSSMDDGWDSSGLVSSLDDSGAAAGEGEDYPFKCIIVRESKVRDGERVAIRLLEDMVVGGLLIPKNTHLMATATIGKRLFFKVSSVEVGGRIYSLNYDAYDAHDGTMGIYCPDLNKAIKDQAKSRALSSVSSRLRGGILGVAGDVVDVGVSVAQSAQGVVTVTVPAGYPFFIVASKQN